MRIVVGITGASGAVYGVKLLVHLKKLGAETHLVVSRWAEYTLKTEAGMSLSEVRELAAHSYSPDDLAAPIASGSFLHDGMIVAPCSMKTLAAIACGFSDNLISRAADVTIKEGRRLVLLPRETPLNAVHLENMLRLARCGVIIMPPVPAFYGQPKTVDDVVEHSVGRALSLVGIKNDLYFRWGGLD